MMTEADKAVLDESYKNARMGREAINVMIGKVDDDDLALDLTGRLVSLCSLKKRWRNGIRKNT